MNDGDIEKAITVSLNDVLEINDKSVSELNISEVSFIGDDAIFDSLSVVHFISSLERKLRDVTNKDVKLVDDRAFDPDKSPFKNIESLKELIKEKVNA